MKTYKIGIIGYGGFGKFLHYWWNRMDLVSVVAISTGSQDHNDYPGVKLVQADTLLSVEACLEPMVINKPIILANILYEFNSAELTEASKVTLDTLFQVMVDNPTIEIELSAHTDNIGAGAYNLELSDKRAKSCVDYLLGKGITVGRLTAKGYGFGKPVAPNQLKDGRDNPEGRALNRRTEFKVTKKN